MLSKTMRIKINTSVYHIVIYHLLAPEVSNKFYNR